MAALRVPCHPLAESDGDSCADTLDLSVSLQGQFGGTGGGDLGVSGLQRALMFIGGSFYAAASSAVEALTGFRTVASRHASEVAELTARVDTERRARHQLQQEVGDLSGDLVNEQRVSQKLRSELSDVSDDLANERAVTRQLRGEAAELSNELLFVRKQLDEETLDLVTYRGRKVAVSEAVEETADLISARARNSASREIGSMAGESLPWLGTAVIVGVTTLEIRDLCATLEDMNELKLAFNPDLAPDEAVSTVCAMQVPTREELWAAVKESPRSAWDRASKEVAKLPSLKEIEVPDIDWESYWDAMGNRFREYYDSSIETVVVVWINTGKWTKDTWRWLRGEDELPEEALKISE